MASSTYRDSLPLGPPMKILRSTGIIIVASSRGCSFRASATRCAMVPGRRSSLTAVKGCKSSNNCVFSISSGQYCGPTPFLEDVETLQGVDERERRATDLRQRRHLPIWLSAWDFHRKSRSFTGPCRLRVGKCDENRIFEKDYMCLSGHLEFS